MYDFIRNIAHNWKASQSRSVGRKRGITKRPTSNRTSRSTNSSLEYVRFEDRRVLASIYLDPVGTLWVSGTEGPDTMLATTVPSFFGSMVQVTVNNLTFTRAISQINEMVFIGRAGNDVITNNTHIPSRMFGGPGDDVLTGGFGNDLLVGGPGDDMLFGRGGDDVLIGSRGNNTLDGGPGNDRLFGGYGGNNILRGGAGDDIIFAGDLGDEIHSGPGNNQIYGNVGPDLIYGGPGQNVIMGNGGDDVIIVEGSGNFISGGSGDDSIYVRGNNNTLRGGLGNDGLMAWGQNNRILPGLGDNRILVPPGQPVPSLASNNAAVRFVNKSSNWTLREIEAVDHGLRAVHLRTEGTMVLRDTTSNQPLTFAKYQANDPALAGKQTLNSLEGNFVVHGNGSVTATYQREIRVGAFNANNLQQFRAIAMAVVREISHNWDSSYEINRRLPGSGNIWPEFIGISTWRNHNPGAGFVQAQTPTREPFEFQVVGGNVQIPTRTWWYRGNSMFTHSSGRDNAKADWAATWEYLFSEPIFGSVLPGYSNVVPKVDKVNQLLDSMS